MNANDASRSFRVLSSLVMCSLLVALVSGCSSFRREWTSASTMVVPPNEITGRWEGEWRSNKNGHHGRLRCIVTKQSEGEYSAHFHAVYWKILRVSYAVRLHGQRANELFRFRGEEDLGKLAGGIYEYEGTVTSSRFSSTYHCRYDHGTFEMGRLPQPAVIDSK